MASGSGAARDREDLRRGDCQLDGPNPSRLRVAITALEVGGACSESPGTSRCIGRGVCELSLEAVSPSGQSVWRGRVRERGERNCGATFCSAREASWIAEGVIGDAVARATIAVDRAGALRPATAFPESQGAGGAGQP